MDLLFGFCLFSVLFRLVFIVRLFCYSIVLSPGLRCFGSLSSICSMASQCVDEFRKGKYEAYAVFVFQSPVRPSFSL